MDEINQPNIPEQFTIPNQGSEHYENEIKELERRLIEKKADYEQAQKKIEHKEMLGEVIKERLEEVSGIKIEQPQITSEVMSDIGLGAHPMTPQVQIKLQGLINDVFQKGMNYAVAEVKKINDPYLLVLFRDALAVHFYSVLVERGIIKEI